jgi:rRNA maturation endonuclease Nob1
MNKSRCVYCGHAFKPIKDEEICASCKLQYKDIYDKVANMYIGVLKNLRDR